MAISAGQVKELRELTSAGMMDCKKALEASDGNIEKAVEFLREKGLAAAQKKAGRIAAEGLVSAYISDDNAIGAIVEVNSETDFVAKNQEFRTFVAQVARQAALSETTELDAFMNARWLEDDSITVNEALTQKISIIGENLKIRRFEKFVKATPGALVSYIHGEGRIAVLIEVICENESPLLADLGKNLSMQIAALHPQFVNRADVPKEFIEKEREILRTQALNEGKDAKIVDKMVEGRLTKELKEFCLMEQLYVKNTEMTVKAYVDSVAKELNSPITVARFVRYETGEGIEKKSENFAEEVSKVIQG